MRRKAAIREFQIQPHPPPFLYDDGVLPASVWLNEQLAPIRCSDLTLLGYKLSP